MRLDNGEVSERDLPEKTPKQGLHSALLRTADYSIASFTTHIASTSHPKTRCESLVPCPMADSLIFNSPAYVASLRSCPSSPDQLSGITGMRNEAEDVHA